MYKDLTDIQVLKQLLGKEGITPARSSGQNFLICREVVEATVELLKAGPQRVTELGAGLGTLTGSLLGAGFQVKAIEKDEKLARVLRTNLRRKAEEQLILRVADLKIEAWDWPEPYQLAGNIPYNLSGLIIRRITQLDPGPEAVVLLVQKEVGERLCAGSGQQSLMSTAVNLWGEGQKVLSVPSDCFWPSPKVDSELVILLPDKNQQALKIREEALAVAKVFYQQKRKQIGGVLKKEFNLTNKEMNKVIEGTGVDLAQRPQEIEPVRWILLARNLKL